MKNYKEKEKKLENVLNKLNTLSNNVIKMNEHINFLNIEKNQLLSEKEESDKNYNNLQKQHQQLKLELEKIQKGVKVKFGEKDHINEKIDELNQETESLIDEIEKWQT